MYLRKTAEVALVMGLGLRMRLWIGMDGRCGAGGKEFSAARARAKRGIGVWESRQAHRNACTKLWMSLSNSGSCLRRASILRIEWITVE